MAWLPCDYGEVLARLRRIAELALAMKALRAAPQDVTFIDDRLENVLAARGAGMRATLFTSSSQIAGPAAPGTVPEGAGQ